MTVLDRLRIPPETDEVTDEIPDDISGVEFDQKSVLDPAPGEPPKKTAAPKAKVADGAPPKVTPKVRREVAEEVEAYLEMLAFAWSMSAPPCAEALSESSTVIAAKITNLMARNPRLVAKFRDAGVFGDVMALAIAMKGVVAAAYAFYVRKEGEDDGADGGGFDVTRFAPYAPGA